MGRPLKVVDQVAGLGDGQLIGRLDSIAVVQETGQVDMLPTGNRPDGADLSRRGGSRRTVVCSVRTDSLFAARVTIHWRPCEPRLLARKLVVDGLSAGALLEAVQIALENRRIQLEFHAADGTERAEMRLADLAADTECELQGHAMSSV